MGQRLDLEFKLHVVKYLVHKEELDHLPISVFSYVIPTLHVPFLLHIMLSMGQFETELDLVAHLTLRESLKHCRLIQPEEYEVLLQQ